MVSSDVYAEIGDTILIPKGSRLIGGYSFDSDVAKARININWNRVILPHGIDIAISSPGTDEVGRAGVAGIVDSKIASALFSAIMLAGVSTGAAVMGQEASNLFGKSTAMDMGRSITATKIDFSSLKDVITGEQQMPSSNGWKLGLGAIRNIKNAKNEQELLKIMKEEIAHVLKITEDKVGITMEDVEQLLQPLQKKSSKSVYEEAIGRAINDFSRDMQDIVNKHTDKKPTVYVDQGTALKVFVNQDIVFPPQAILNQ